MDSRPEHASTTGQPVPASNTTICASTPRFPPSRTTLALTIMLAHRTPFSHYTLRPLAHPQQNGITLPPPIIFGQPSFHAPPPKSQLSLPRMADRAFSQYTHRRKETIFPNPYQEDLCKLNGYCKNVTSYTDRASWDFSSKMPKPAKFKSSWTGGKEEMEENNGYDGSDEEDSEDWETEDGKAEDEADDEDASASSDDTSNNTSESSRSPPRGRSPTLRRCTNGLWGGYCGTCENYNKRKARATAVILRYWRATRGLREWRDFRDRVVVCQRLWRDRITARGSLGGRRIVTEG